MKIITLLLATTLSPVLLAAEPSSRVTSPVEPEFCHYTNGRYSLGAIIKDGDALYRCVAAYDRDLSRMFVWVRITDAAQSGSEMTIYWQ